MKEVGRHCGEDAGREVVELCGIFAVLGAVLGERGGELRHGECATHAIVGCVGGLHGGQEQADHYFADELAARVPAEQCGRPAAGASCLMLLGV